MGRQQGQGRASSGAGQQWAGWQAEQHRAPHAAELPGWACAGASLPPFSAYSVEHTCLCLPHQRHAGTALYSCTLKQQEIQKCKNVCTEQKKEGLKCGTAVVSAKRFRGHKRRLDKPKEVKATEGFFVHRKHF